MVKEMKISTIIPVYNAGKYIKRCLDSILAQGIEGHEIICINDGSTDNSREILNEYKKTYDNIRVLTQKNSYAGVARNNGLLADRGEYVHFMDADDYVLPGAYAKVYETAKTNNADYVKTRSMSFDKESGIMQCNHYFSMDDFPESIYGKVCSLNNCLEVLLKTPKAPWAGFIKRSYLMGQNIRFNSLKCANDRSFYIDVITHTDRIVICNCHMVCYQTNNKESLVGIRNENFICLIQSYQIIRNITSDVQDDLRRKILELEFRALVRGYEKLDKKQQKKAENEMQLFWEKFDWNDLDGSLLSASVMNPVYKFLKTKIPGECRIKTFTALAEIYANSRQLVLYGAGKVCHALLQHLEEESCDLGKISRILVSDKAGNPEHIMKIPVSLEEDYDLNSVSDIVIATFENVQFPIYHRLSTNASCNIWTVTDNLYASF